MADARGPLAVVGVSALFPGSSDARGFWRDILAGKDLITEVPPSHWLVEDYFDPDPKAPDKTYARRGGFLGEVEFDPLEHGVPPSIVPATDTAQLLALIVARQVLEDATGGQFDHVDRERVSVILGVTSAQELLIEASSRLQRPVWVKALREQGLGEDEVQAACDRIAASYTPWQESTFPGLLGNVVAGRIANRLDLGGTNCVTDAACASSFSALSMAASELWLGQSDLAIVGGVEALNDIFMYMCFSKTPALSPSGVCRPFAASADGTLLGEGIGMLAIRRLADAERDGDRIYAVLRGIGSSSDGRAKSVYAPLPEGQARALRRAYDHAGYGPESVELVEAHGTGTRAGDAAEFEALRQVFEASGRRDQQWCALGTVKSQIGHTKAAAGAAGLFKAVMAVQHGVLPPTLGAEQPNPALRIEASPFYLSPRARPWVRGAGHPRRAAVSSFGFGGSNFHITLEEYAGAGKRALRHWDSPSELVLLAADDAAQLRARCEELRDELRPGRLAVLAHRSQDAFDARQPARLAAVASEPEELRAKLERGVRHLAASPGEELSSPDGLYLGVGAVPGSVAFLFPGQGSQYLEMGADLALAFPLARAAWDAAAGSDALPEPLHDVVFPRPVTSDAAREAQQRKLTATEWAQPALAVASQAQLSLLRAVGVTPDACGGHSFGELSALHAAGALDAATALRLARRRGERMAAASERPGAMLAVSLDLESVTAQLAEWGAELAIANHNAPRQVVLSGEAERVDAVAGRFAERGVTVRRLPVATAFHSPLVAPAAEGFLADLEAAELREPALLVASNRDGSRWPADAAAGRRQLAEQIARPVRFVATLEALWDAGVRSFVEVGPGSVLTRLVGDCLGERPHRAIALDQRGRHGVTSLWHGLGQLAVAGVPLRLRALREGVAPVPDPDARPAKPHALRISGANYAKPYPPPGGAAALPPPNPAREPRPAMAAPAAPTRVEPPLAAPPAVALTPGTPVASELSADAVAAWLEVQRRTAAAHESYLRTMGEAHAAFLHGAERAQAALLGQSLPAEAPALAAQRQPQAAPLAVPAAPAIPAAAAPRVEAPPAAVPPARTAPATQDLARVLLEVVADKTGYPAELLQPEMQLEADLGVDSIKRVEILAALQQRAPDLPEVQPADVAALRTLGQIADFLQAAPAAPAPAAVPAPAALAVAGRRTPAPDLARVLLEVVADKTGYPAELLQPEMQLEADLGVDSIKRVEILAALQERAPDLPEVQPADLAALRTLGQIADFLNAAAPARSAPPAGPIAPTATTPASASTTTSTPTTTPTTAAPTRDLQRVLLEVVADKTGYPAELLRPEMQLEADLGVDSIKRVEILAALQERAPDLPEVQPADVAALRTLGQIVDFLRATPASPGPGAASADPVAASAPEALVLGRHALCAVPAPIQEPRPLLPPGLPVAVRDGGSGVGTALVERLRGGGVDATLDDGSGRGSLVLLDGLAGYEAADDAACDAAAAGLDVCRRVFRAVRDHLATAEGGVVTVQDTGGDFGLAGRAGERAWSGGLPGLLKTAALEHPERAFRALDLERGGRSPEQLAECLARELLAGGPELEVGLRADGSRLSLALRRSAASADGPLPGPDDVVVVTGGGRGVTAACAVALAHATQPKLALFGRTPLGDEPAELAALREPAALRRALLERAVAAGRTPTPAELRAGLAAVLANRELRATLEAIRASGAHAVYHAVDIADAAALAAALDLVRAELGPISGVIHGAGALRDRRLVEKTDADLERVLAPKVEGLRALLDATRRDPLRWLLLFSSMAARSGNPGQSDYALANEILNQVAASEAVRRGGATSVRALGWGPWDGGMVDAILAERFRQRGIPLIPVAAGAEALLRELRSPGGAPVVVLGEQPTLAATSAAPAPRAERSAELSVRVAALSHAYLDGHRIRGVPVLPLALALDWLARAAARCRPDLSLLSCRDVKVRSGVRLERFESEGHELIASAREVSNGAAARLALELRAADGRVHYTATAQMGAVPRAPRVEAAAAPARPDAGPPPGASDVYDGQRLFHGPAFHAIRSLEALDAENGSAVLAGLSELGWPDEPWQLDAAALDGALQLALLHARLVLGSAALPTAIGSLLRHAVGPLRGPLRCVLGLRSRSALQVTSDVVLSDASGAPLLELHGLEVTALPETGDPALPLPVKDTLSR